MRLFSLLLSALFLCAFFTVDRPVQPTVSSTVYDPSAAGGGGGGTPASAWESYDGSQDEYQQLVTAGDDYGSLFVGLSDGVTGLLAYRSSSTSGGVVYAKVTRATASDTTLTQSATTSSTYSETDFPRACLNVSSTRAICAFQQKTGTDSLVTQLIDLSGSTPSITDTDVDTTIVPTAGGITNIVNIGTDKYFFLASAVTTNDIYGFVVSISGDTLTVTGSDTGVDAAMSEGVITSYATDKVYGIVAGVQRIYTISGTTTSAGDTETLVNLDTASTLTPAVPFGVAYTGNTDKILVTYRRRVESSGGRNMAAKVVSVASDTIDSSGTAYDINTRFGGTAGQSTMSTVNIDDTYFYSAWEEDTDNIEGVIMYYSSGDDSIRRVNNQPVQITSDNLDHISISKWDSNSVVIVGQNESSAPIKQTGARVIFGNGSNGQTSWYPLTSYVYTGNSFNITSDIAIAEDYCTDDAYTRLFTNDSTDDVIRQYNITAYNTSTGVFTLSYQSANDYALTGAGTPVEGTSRGIDCDATVDNLILIGNGNDEAHQLEFGTAGDLSTVTYTSTTTFAGDETNPRSITWDKEDYTRLFKVGFQGDNYNSYNMSEAKNIATETNNQIAQAFPNTLTNPVKIIVDDKGTSFIVSNGTFTRANRIRVDEYNVSNWLQTDTVSTEWTATTTNIRGIEFSSDYSRMWLMNTSGVFYVFETNEP